MFQALHSRCDGLSRRSVLEIGSLGFLGFSLAQWQRLKAASTSADTSCIFVWLDGGPSHLETFDLKPEAPIEVRGTFQAIPSKVPGVHVCEHLPRIARLMDKVTLIRTLTSEIGEHDQAGHYWNTGYRPTPAVSYPSFGSVVSKAKGTGAALPPYVAVPSPRPYMGPGYLPGSYSPFTVGGDPSRPDYKVRDLDLPVGFTEERLRSRQSMLARIDSFERALQDHPKAKDRDSYFEQAYRLVTSPQAKAAFDLAKEKPETRKRYGHYRLGQSCLLARRLIEAGARFVSVVDTGWDTHTQIAYNLTYGFPGKLPGLDQAYSALIEDLSERGLLKKTLVVLMGEFGRTPKVNPSGGRDHWPRANSMLLAGGGVLGGQVIGRTDHNGELPAEDPVTPQDLARTLYTLLGVDPDQTFKTPDGRPIKLVDGGNFVRKAVSG
ncbi:MAG: DUF1501 domain-containing protein [Acidobacteria bacterium]|nr:DUF1501 domain-containing protein [Acidobacteriota bacterium]